MSSKDPRVLSIQSHVVSGYCGNKSAVFPLQTLGFDVDFVNSVQFSTHTGYPTWTGQVLNENDLFELFSGLKANQLHSRYTQILTGYARSASFLEAMHQVIKEVKEASPDALYLCDPVMGDNGRMYVPEELLPIYRDKIIPLADIVCPNQFEAELLSGIKITDMRSALAAIDHLHSVGIKTVVISSTELTFSGNSTAKLVSLASSTQSGHRQIYKIEIPRVEASFIGTGDLFAALFLAWFSRTQFDLKVTLENVIATLQAIIRRTFEHASKAPGGIKLWANTELKIIQSREDILMPKVEIPAEPISVL